MDEDAALALRGDHEHHRQQVRGQARPGGVGEGHDGPVQEGVYLVAFLRRHIDVVAPLLQVHAQAAEGVRNDAQVVPRHILDGDFALVDGGHADERAHLDHIRQNAVVCAVELLHAVDPQEVGAHAVDERAHPVEHLAQLLQVRLAGGVVDGGRAPRKDGGHHDIGRTGHGSLVQQHIAAGQPVLGGQMERTAGGVILHVGAQGDHAREVRVHAPAADLVAARLREPRVPEAAQQRSHDHHRPAERRALLHELLRLDVRRVHLVRLEPVGALLQALDLHTHPLQQADEVLHVQDLRNVGENDRIGRQQHRADDFQGLVLRALRGDFAGQLVSAFDDEFSHITRALLQGGVQYRIFP